MKEIFRRCVLEELWEKVGAFLASKPCQVRNMMEISVPSQLSWSVQKKVSINYGPPHICILH